MTSSPGLYFVYFKCTLNKLMKLMVRIRTGVYCTTAAGPNCWFLYPLHRAFQPFQNISIVMSVWRRQNATNKNDFQKNKKSFENENPKFLISWLEEEENNFRKWFSHFLKNSFTSFVWVPVWPDLSKFRHFGKFLKVIGNLSKDYLVFAQVLNLLWKCFVPLGAYYFAINDQKLAKIISPSGHTVIVSTNSARC